MNTKSIKELNMRNKTQTFREENMRIHLCGKREDFHTHETQSKISKG